MPTDKKPKTRSILVICQEEVSMTGASALSIESPMTGRQMEEFVALLCFILDLDPEVALELVIEDEVPVSKSKAIPMLVIGVREETLTRMMQIIDFEYRKALKELRLS